MGVETGEVHLGVRLAAPNEVRPFMLLVLHRASSNRAMYSGRWYGHVGLQIVAQCWVLIVARCKVGRVSRHHYVERPEAGFM